MHHISAGIHVSSCKHSQSYKLLVSMKKKKRSLVAFTTAVKVSSTEATGTTSAHKSLGRTSHMMLLGHMEARMSHPCMCQEGREL